MTSKALHKFKQRVAYLKADLELSHALVRNFVEIQDSPQNLVSALGRNLTEYPSLKRRNTQASRTNIGGHLVTSTRMAFVKSLYENFLEYLSALLVAAAANGIDPARFVGDAQINLDAKKLLSAGGWFQVVDIISGEIFRSLENERNTRKLIEKIIRRLGLSIENALVESALPYFEVRHLLVHADGKTDEKFRATYPHIPRTSKSKVKMSHSLVGNAEATVMALASKIDEEANAKGLIGVLYRQG